MKEEIKTIPNEELEEFDVNAVDMRFEDEVFYTEDENIENNETSVAPTTHGIEEVVQGTLEEV
jgi:hypothetical protein